MKVRARPVMYCWDRVGFVLERKTLFGWRQVPRGELLKVGAPATYTPHVFQSYNECVLRGRQLYGASVEVIGPFVIRGDTELKVGFEYE